MIYSLYGRRHIEYELNLKDAKPMWILLLDISDQTANNIALNFLPMIFVCCSDLICYGKIFTQ
jgi:hypothetical protein